jgi:endonuclease I
MKILSPTSVTASSWVVMMMMMMAALLAVGLTANPTALVAAQDTTASSSASAPTAATAVTTTSATTSTSASSADVHSGCGVDEYYAGLVQAASATSNGGTADSSQWTLAQVQTLVTSTHRTQLPALATGEGTAKTSSILDALVDLDADVPDPKTNASTVRALFRDIPMLANQQNIPEGWRRGDLWPTGRGAGIATAAGTDVHAKRPMDWDVFVTLENYFWGECGTVELQERCIVPAIPSLTANDTATDKKIKTPPVHTRGSVARSVLYAALRYGSELGLTVTDCPPFGTTEYGYKSELLSWHAAHPPTADEVARNDRACRMWQGNRNPFVDFPELVAQIFGEPDTVDAVEDGAHQYSQCSAPTMSPTATPNSCSGLGPGDVHVLIFNSDPIDQIVLFPVIDIPADVGSIFVTDMAWNGTAFVTTDEGTLEVSWRIHVLFFLQLCFFVAIVVFVLFFPSTIILMLVKRAWIPFSDFGFLKCCWFLPKNLSSPPPRAFFLASSSVPVRHPGNRLEGRVRVRVRGALPERPRELDEHGDLRPHQRGGGQHDRVLHQRRRRAPHPAQSHVQPGRVQRDWIAHLHQFRNLHARQFTRGRDGGDRPPLCAQLPVRRRAGGGCRGTARRL